MSQLVRVNYDAEAIRQFSIERHRTQMEETYLAHTANSMLKHNREPGPSPVFLYSFLFADSGTLQITGYTDCSVEELQARSERFRGFFAEDPIREVPVADMRSGDRIEFRLICNPVVKPKQGHEETILDVFRAQGDQRSAEDILSDWIKQSLQRRGARVLDVSVRPSKLRVTRKARVKYHYETMDLVVAHFDGLLEIDDADLFRSRIGFGFGRQRGFGFGRLQLSTEV